MLTNRLEELWLSADDGASSPIGPRATRTESEFDDLLDAWFVERRNSIECQILLDQSRKIIRRLLDRPDIPPSRLRQARRLIRAIDQALRADSE